MCCWKQRRSLKMLFKGFSDTNRSTAGLFWPSSHRLWNWAVCPLWPASVVRGNRSQLPHSSLLAAVCWSDAAVTLLTHTHTHISLPDTQTLASQWPVLQHKSQTEFVFSERAETSRGLFFPSWHTVQSPSCQSQRPHLHSGTSCVCGGSNQISEKLKVNASYAGFRLHDNGLRLQNAHFCSWEWQRASCVPIDCFILHRVS